MNEDYFSREGDLLASMRLLVEGANQLFEEDAQPIFRVAVKNGAPKAATAFDTIGVALRRLQTQICELQDAHTEETVRQLNIEA